MDVTQMSPAEVIAEAERRTALRAAGKPLSGGPGVTPMVLEGNPAPRSVIKEQFTAALYSSVEIEPSWIVVGETFRRMVLPWSALVPDNERTMPVIRGGKAITRLTDKYRDAKEKARGILAEQCAGRAPLEGRIQVVATLFEPNRTSRRDVSNYEKLVHDALSGIAYVDDSQIDDLRWRRGQMCIDRPRLEISVSEVNS